jgi:hypothetical protein
MQKRVKHLRMEILAVSEDVGANAKPLVSRKKSKG